MISIAKRSELLKTSIAFTHIEEGKEPYYTYEEQYTKEEIKAQLFKANDIALKATGYSPETNGDS